MAITTNFIKKISEKKITEEVHNAFVRYSLGEFVKEPLTIKVGKNDFSVSGGFEYLDFFQQFLSLNLKEEVEIDGVIESVRALEPKLEQLGLTFEVDRRFGKSGSKFVLIPQKISIEKYRELVEELFGEYLLFGVSFNGGKLKVKKKTTPKLGSPTVNFVSMKLPLNLLSIFKEDYLFDSSGDFKEAKVEHIYIVEDINFDMRMMEKDPNTARRNALRSGTIIRKVTVDGKVKENKIQFNV